MAFCEPPSRMPLLRSVVCCRVWDSRRLTLTSASVLYVRLAIWLEPIPLFLAEAQEPAYSSRRLEVEDLM